MPSLILELFSEEIPARMQAAAEKHLADTLCGELQKAGVLSADAAVASFSTPRRLALVIPELLAIQPDVTIEKKGPKTSAPQAAVEGFLKSSGLTLEQLEKRMVGKDETYFAVIHQKGQPTASLLKSLIEKMLAEFPWPKSMRWGSGETRWVRPLQSILCVFNGEVIPVTFAGVTAGNITYGHRFLAPQAITITNPADYESALKNAFVWADREGRKGIIFTQANEAAAKHGLVLKRDDGLLEEVTGLVEYPTVLVGTIDAQFMDLPPEVLTSEMRAHQKYFALLRSESRSADRAAVSATHTSPSHREGQQAEAGDMSNRFLITANITTEDEGKAIIAGNERVLRARLADGRFFWDQDRKKPLSEWAEGLEGVTFHAKIGTIADKVKRITTLAETLESYVPQADKVLVTRAAQLCKADLVTGMVGEFPELQGVMGRYYATAQNEPKEVANAIAEHYLPLGPDSPVPAAPVSVCVALADKLDTLISMFAVGEKPTGSKDPFALRRSALGIIRILLENKLRIPLKQLLNEELFSFFTDRLKVMLKDQGIRHDIINAVIANGDDDLTRVVARAQALQGFLGSIDGANLLAAYKRAGNIVAAEEKKDKTTYDASKLNASLLEVPEETVLATLLATSSDQLKVLIAEEKHTDAMETLSALREPTDRFFDKILVNCEQPELRRERLHLLAQLRDLMNKIADFSMIEG